MDKVYVVGLGKSGIAAAKLLQQQGYFVTISDRSFNPELQAIQSSLQNQGIAVNLGSSPNLEDSLPSLLVVSPGVPWDTPWLQQARDRGIDTIGELELAWRYLQSLPWVGVTGTNGKTTTTALIAAMFQTAGLNAPACGNIGNAACELAVGLLPDWVIAEISSFQIESSSNLAPLIGVWTTFTPDHLNRHYTLENYYQIKASLLSRCQYQILNGDDSYLASQVREWENAYWTSIKGTTQLTIPPEKSVYIQDNQVIAFGKVILPLTSFRMFGEHNQQNLLLAVAAASLAQIEPEAIRLAVSNFSGVPHRLEDISTVNNIRFINDSKATNYDAALVGLKSVNPPVILIAGGEAKTGDDRPWIEMIKTKVSQVFLIGKDASTLAASLERSSYTDYLIVETMEKAVKQAYQLAQSFPNAVVLLSPACASYDQYRSFEHRGDHFRQLCLELIH